MNGDERRQPKPMRANPLILEPPEGIEPPTRSLQNCGSFSYQRYTRECARLEAFWKRYFRWRISAGHRNGDKVETAGGA